jgi:hypothetical protein
MTVETFIGYINNGKIVTSYNQHVGYTIDEYNKVLDTAKQYQQILYDKGILEKPKTTEEINKEMQQTLAQAQAMMATMSATITDLNAKLSSANANSSATATAAVKGGESNVKQINNNDRNK